MFAQQAYSVGSHKQPPESKGIAEDGTFIDLHCKRFVHLAFIYWSCMGLNRLPCDVQTKVSNFSISSVLLCSGTGHEHVLVRQFPMGVFSIRTKHMFSTCPFSAAEAQVIVVRPVQRVDRGPTRKHRENLTPPHATENYVGPARAHQRSLS